MTTASTRRRAHSDRFHRRRAHRLGSSARASRRSTCPPGRDPPLPIRGPERARANWPPRSCNPLWRWPPTRSACASHRFDPTFELGRPPPHSYLTDPIKATTTQYRPLPNNAALGLSAFYIALLTMMCGFLGGGDREQRRGLRPRILDQRDRAALAPTPAAADQPLADAARQMAHRRGPHRCAHRAGHSSWPPRWRAWTSPYPVLLWLFMWLCAASVGIGTLVLFAVRRKLRTAHRLAAVRLRPPVRLGGRDGAGSRRFPGLLRVPEQRRAAPRDPGRGTRSIMYFGARADAGLAHGARWPPPGVWVAALAGPRRRHRETGTTASASTASGPRSWRTSTRPSRTSGPRSPISPIRPTRPTRPSPPKQTEPTPPPDGAQPPADGPGARRPRGRAKRATAQPVRRDQGLAARGLPADPGRPDGARPQPGELLRPDRAGRVRRGEHGPGHRAEPGPDGAGADVRLRRLPALPQRHQLRPAAGQPAGHRGAQLQQGRPDALPAQRGPAGLRAQQLRRAARPTASATATRAGSWSRPRSCAPPTRRTRTTTTSSSPARSTAR